MAVETPREPGAALAGLDQLELAPPQQAKRHVLAKIWAAAWPKLLALVLALAIWQLVYLSGFKSGILPGPAATLPDLWHQLHTAQLWRRSAPRCAARSSGSRWPWSSARWWVPWSPGSGRCGPRSAR